MLQELEAQWLREAAEAEEAALQAEDARKAAMIARHHQEEAELLRMHEALIRDDAAAVLQGGLKGCQTRRETQLKRVEESSVTHIQRIVRGRAARHHAAALRQAPEAMVEDGAPPEEKGGGLGVFQTR